jgi:mono/diheme cytochrome c family protein
MKIKFKAFASIAIVAASTLILGSCTSNPDSSGSEYMPDMYRSPAIEPYVDYGEVRGKSNDDFRMTRSALVPPANTIPYYGKDSATVRMMLPYARKANIAMKTSHGLFDTEFSMEDEYVLAAAEVNPLTLTADNSSALFKKGKELFTANCAHCHGDKGDGNGPMMLSGAYTGVINYKNLAISEGQMFYSIYYGKGAMGGHASILDKKEIWTLVHYVKKFQDENYGKPTSELANVSDTL